MYLVFRLLVRQIKTSEDILEILMGIFLFSNLKKYFVVLVLI